MAGSAVERKRSSQETSLADAEAGMAFVVEAVVGPILDSGSLAGSKACSVRGTQAVPMQMYHGTDYI